MLQVFYLDVSKVDRVLHILQCDPPYHNRGPPAVAAWVLCMCVGEQRDGSCSVAAWEVEGDGGRGRRRQRVHGQKAEGVGASR
jgi:hypothetical protein